MNGSPFFQKFTVKKTHWVTVALCSSDEDFTCENPFENPFLDNKVFFTVQIRSNIFYVNLQIWMFTVKIGFLALYYLHKNCFKLISKSILSVRVTKPHNSGEEEVFRFTHVSNSPPWFNFIENIIFNKNLYKTISISSLAGRVTKPHNCGANFNLPDSDFEQEIIHFLNAFLVQIPNLTLRNVKNINKKFILILTLFQICAKF